MSEPDVVVVFEDSAHEFRWRRLAPNGEPIATSGEGYTRSTDAWRAARRAHEGLDVVYRDDAR